MAVSFLDTSALVRRYDPAEPGAASVRALCRPSSGHKLLISVVTSIEFVSAINRKLREGTFDRAARDRRWRLFRRHRRDQYHVIGLDARVYRRAEQLLFAHPLRAYDALQLATALLAGHLLASLAEYRFYTADRTQAAAAAAEGLQAELIA